ncbi:DUF1206 domain-containing protein [Arthrobacter globiformis]|uniref:DUF1206 domain-containing protein n=1 Tax=Arthrobacter globiformis TaxID=1665 RepID=UPI0027D76CCB|nr:DUF1206 domain-containing protein [Arthrobacter globiformis]
MRSAAGKAEDVSNSKPLEMLARGGFAVSGVLHILVGLITFGLARGRGGRADVSGAVAELASQPAGPVLLWCSFAACVALALWQAGDAIFDFERLPAKHKAGKKLQAAAQAAVYAGLAFTLAAFARGAGKDNRESASDLTVTLMKAPGGVLLLVLIGAAVAVVGIVYAVRGFQKSFEKHINLPSSPRGRKAITGLGVAGYVAKGVALFVTGLLVVIATVTVHPEQSTGLDGGLRALREQPYGVYVLAAVGAGLICYGVFMVVRARLARM